MVEIFLVTIGTAKLRATFQTNGAVTNFAPEMGSAWQARRSAINELLWK
jgi:hypothetical protein